jgi:hypothetical protein
MSVPSRPLPLRLPGAIALLVLLAAASAAAPARAGLIAQWNFNETGGTVAHDSVGSFNGNLLGNATFAPGQGINGGGAISLNRATNDSVDMGNVLPLGSGDFSIQAWVKTTDQNYDIIAGRQYADGTVSGYLLMGNFPTAGAQGKANFYVSNPDPSTYTYSTTNYNDGSWHQLVGVYHAGGTMSLYVDGMLESTKPSYPNTVYGNPDFMVGGITLPGGPTGYYTGLITDVAVWDNALTSAQVEANYRDTIGTPEPSTFAPALVAALAGLGYAARRSRRRH